MGNGKKFKEVTMAGKWFTLFLCFLFVTGIAIAEPTSKANYSVNIDSEIDSDVQNFLNSQDYITHTHQYNERREEMGIGADIIVWQNESRNEPVVEDVRIETRVDFNNDNEVNVYGVVTLNIFDIIQGDR